MTAAWPECCPSVLAASAPGLLVDSTDAATDPIRLSGCLVPTPCRLAARAAALEGEAAALRADNERLCRVVDSGDWGRARVEELVQVGPPCPCGTWGGNVCLVGGGR